MTHATITFREVEIDGDISIDVQIVYGDDGVPNRESYAHRSAAHVFNHISDLLTPKTVVTPNEK